MIARGFETPLSAFGRPLEVEVDTRDIRGGDKQWEWIKKGVPLRIELGPRDIEGGTVMIARRDKGPRDKENVPRAEVAQRVPKMLAEMQAVLFERARAYRDAATRVVDDRKELGRFFDEGGGFALVHWDGTPETEAKLREELKATIRCIAEAPNPAAPWADTMFERGSCIVSGRPSERRVVLARAY